MFFFIASEMGHIDLAKYLVQNLSNVNEKNNNDEIALHYGKKLKKIEYSDIRRHCLLFLLASREGHTELAKYLVHLYRNTSSFIQKYLFI